MTLPEVGSGMQIPVLLFFILKHLRSQLIEKVDHMNMDAYKKHIIKAFFLVSSIWDYSP